jgi:hypothetical protein
MPTSFDISPLKSSCHRFALLLLLLGPLMVQALPIEEDAMAKGGRGGGGGGRGGRGGDKSFWSKTVNFGTMKIPIIVFIVICSSYFSLVPSYCPSMTSSDSKFFSSPSPLSPSYLFPFFCSSLTCVRLYTLPFFSRSSWYPRRHLFHPQMLLRLLQRLLRMHR